MRLAILKILALTACIWLVSCSEKPGEQHAEFFVFGTLMEVTTWGADKQLSRKAFARLHAQFQDMHRDWHAWEPGLLTEINDAFAAGQAVTANPAILELTRRSQEIEEQSGGRFNPAIGGLVRLWGFHTSDYPIEGPPPGKAAIEDLLKQNPSSLDVRIHGQEMSTRNRSVQLDFGGIAKGYATDLAIDTLDQMGISNAIVNAGGDLRAVGRHGDRPWRVAIRDPAGGIIGVVESREDEAIFTSGNYERYRQENNQRYPHILDPRTGWPVEEISSVTVITNEGLLADAAATALIVAGLSEWQDVAYSLNLDKVLLIDENGRVYLTAEMNKRIGFSGKVDKKIIETL
ncbi:MAG: FAD:protein FMN transferase [Gammaproteobacteria bacterium]|nr:FAD:protein FMN transferase [Gammaproteobacteria bacterium]